MNITVNRGAPLWEAIILAYGEQAAGAIAEIATALYNAKNEGHQEGFEEGYQVAHEIFYAPAAIEMPDLAEPVQPPTKEDLQFATDELPDVHAGC
jgi:flagellar biosynthesis/type III secretory pathway protein FliH